MLFDTKGSSGVARKTDLLDQRPPALELGLLATAPIAEGRYGLLILVTGQLSVLTVALGKTRL